MGTISLKHAWHSAAIIKWVFYYLSAFQPCLASINNHRPAVWRTGATPLGSQPSVASQTEPLLALQISPSQISNSQEPQRRAPDCAHKPNLGRMFEEQGKTLSLSNPRVFISGYEPTLVFSTAPIGFSITQWTPFLRKCLKGHILSGGR